MNFNYDKQSDSLYVAFSSNVSADSEEVAPGIVVDYDMHGHIVGLDIEDASKHTNFSNVKFDGFIPNIEVPPTV